jgi:hypothetical protein
VLAAPGGGRKRVVVGEREVDVVAGEQVQRLDRLVLVDPHLDAGMPGREAVDDRYEGASDRRREPGDPDGADRFGARVEVTPSRVDGGDDRHRVLCQPVPGGSEPHPSAVGLDERGPHVTGEGGDSLRDGRGARAQLDGDVLHGAQSRELEEQTQSRDVHRPHCPGIRNGLSMILTWT